MDDVSWIVERTDADNVVSKLERCAAACLRWAGDNAVRIECSGQDDGGVGVACFWRTPKGWAERREHHGTNKVFDAETSAIYQALCALGRRQVRGHQYTVFVDSAIGQVRSDAHSLSSTLQ